MSTGPLNTLLVLLPALSTQQSPHPWVAVARVLPGESDHSLYQSRVFADLLRDVTLAGTRLLQYSASPTLLKTSKVFCRCITASLLRIGLRSFPDSLP